MPWWQGTSTPRLALIGYFLNFLRFFQAKTAVPCGRRDVIVGDVTSRLPAERSRGGEEPPGQVWRGSDSFRIFYDFLKQNPRFYQVAVTSSSMTSHRAYPQNDSRVARNLQAKFGTDGTVSEFSTILLSKIRGSIRSPSLARIGATVGAPTQNTQTDPQTFGFIDKIVCFLCCIFFHKT
jgi:hypothetical protein